MKNSDGGPLLQFQFGVCADLAPARFWTQRLRVTALVGGLALLFAVGPRPAAAIICSEPLNVGDSPEAVGTKCGEASLKEERTLTVEVSDDEGTRRESKLVESWIYDRGSGELVLSVVFQDGRVKEVFSHGYGTMQDFSIDTCHNGSALAVGDSTVEAYLKCGTPLAREKKAGRVEETRGDGMLRRTTLPVEEWTYRYGRDLPGYTVTFENGMAVRITPREFGR